MGYADNEWEVGARTITAASQVVRDRQAALVPNKYSVEEIGEFKTIGGGVLKISLKLKWGLQRRA